MVGILALLLACATAFAAPVFPWLGDKKPEDSLSARFAPPEGHQRVPVQPGSYAEWLRELPLKKGKPPVLLYSGAKKANQDAHVAVADLDVGDKDLQQCADSVIRLRAEYLYSKANWRRIEFHYTNGTLATFTKWAAGSRPRVKGRQVAWRNGVAPPDRSYPSFKKFLENIFQYAGTKSLVKETDPAGTRAITPGDIFLQPGSPGHVVLVLDVAESPGTGKRVFLLGQSFMPAQEFHILRNAGPTSPWYSLEGKRLVTPEWTFEWKDRRLFVDEG